MTVLEGVMPVLVTPMHEDGRPDERGVERLLGHIFNDPQAPIPGLWVLGSTGENFLMSYKHRLEFTRMVAEHCPFERVVLVGCGDPVLSEVLRFFEETADLRIDGYHCLPTDRKLASAATVKYWTMVADHAPKPLWLYSNPARALEPAIAAVREMADHPNVAGMKVGGFDLQTISPITALNSPEFQVIGAGGANHLAYLGLGVTCCTMSTACTFPRLHAEVHTLWSQGHLDEARQKARWISAMISQWPPRQNTEAAAEEKAVLELMGVCERWVYPPFEPLDEARLTRMREVLEHGQLLEPLGQAH